MAKVFCLFAKKVLNEPFYDASRYAAKPSFPQAKGKLFIECYFARVIDS